jgi:hypothetical protein
MGAFLFFNYIHTMYRFGDDVIKIIKKAMGR